MRKLTTWAIAAALILTTLFAAAGCSVMSGEDKKIVDTLSFDGEGVEADTVIAEFDGGQVTFEEFQRLYDKYVDEYAFYGYDLESDEDMRNYVQDTIVNALIEEKVVEMKASERGYYSLDAQNEAEMSDSVAKRYEDMETYFTKKTTEALKADPSLDKYETFDKLVAEESKQVTGVEMTLEDYCVWMEKQMRFEKAIELLKKDELKHVTVTEDSIREWYDTTLKHEQSLYRDNPEMYKENADAFETGESNSPVTYVPEGYSRILHIFTYPYGSVSQIEPEYDKLKARVEEIVVEYGELVLEDLRNGTQENAERVAELREEYITKKNRIEVALEKNNADAKKAIEEAYAELEGGKDFREVLKKYTKDNYFMSHESMVQDGMLISLKYQSVCASEWSNAVKEQFAKLKIGEYSPVFQDEDGFHIIYYVSDEKPGVRALDELWADINAMLLEEQEYYAWEDVKDAWVEAANVTRYEKYYRWYGVKRS